MNIGYFFPVCDSKLPRNGLTLLNAQQENPMLSRKTDASIYTAKASLTVDGTNSCSQDGL